MPVHVHLNLIGWMSMMIFGVAYHILPRFSGKPLWSERLSVWHLWLANIGLIGMVLGWFLKGLAKGTLVLIVFSLIEGLSIFFFVVNMFKTIRAQPALR
jgi:cbb3-type cytochrome oxidase subunit 1